MLLVFNRKHVSSRHITEKITDYERIVSAKQKLFLKNKQHKIFDNSIDHLWYLVMCLSTTKYLCLRRSSELDWIRFERVCWNTYQFNSVQLFILCLFKEGTFLYRSIHLCAYNFFYCINEMADVCIRIELYVCFTRVWMNVIFRLVVEPFVCWTQSLFSQKSVHRFVVFEKWILSYQHHFNIYFVFIFQIRSEDCYVNCFQAINHINYVELHIIRLYYFRLYKKLDYLINK